MRRIKGERALARAWPSFWAVRTRCQAGKFHQRNHLLRKSPEDLRDQTSTLRNTGRMAIGFPLSPDLETALPMILAQADATQAVRFATAVVTKAIEWLRVTACLLYPDSRFAHKYCGFPSLYVTT